MTVRYEVTAVDAKRQRATASVTVVNQDGDLVAVADHILKAL